MSDGLYKSLEEATKTEHVNIDIAQMTVEQVDILIFENKMIFMLNKSAQLLIPCQNCGRKGGLSHIIFIYKYFYPVPVQCSKNGIKNVKTHLSRPRFAQFHNPNLVIVFLLIFDHFLIDLCQMSAIFVPEQALEFCVTTLSEYKNKARVSYLIFFDTQNFSCHFHFLMRHLAPIYKLNKKHVFVLLAGSVASSPWSWAINDTFFLISVPIIVFSSGRKPRWRALLKRWWTKLCANTTMSLSAAATARNGTTSPCWCAISTFLCRTHCPTVQWRRRLSASTPSCSASRTRPSTARPPCQSPPMTLVLQVILTH